MFEGEKSGTASVNRVESEEVEFLNVVESENVVEDEDNAEVDSVVSGLYRKRNAASNVTSTKQRTQDSQNQDREASPGGSVSIFTPA